MAVRDFEGLYEVNCREGIIRSTRTFEMKKPSLGTGGYPKVNLYKNGIRYNKDVHRLVANAAFGYYGIQTDGLCVCHLDEERWDARIVNLAIGTNKENLNFPKAKQRRSEVQKGRHFSEEHRKKISEAKKGKSLSAEAKNKMSESRKGEKNHWFGKHHSEESRKRMSEAKKGKPNISLSKPVGAYKNGELVMAFQSTQEAGRNGFQSGHVRGCCTGRRKTHRGYQWKYM